MTQADLAGKCEVSRAAVAQWEAAEPENRTKPTTEHLMAIAKATAVPLEWLLNDASTLDELWRLTGEFGERPSLSSPAPARQAPAADVLPDMRQGEHLFLFAQTPEQAAAKLKTAADEMPGAKVHLVLVGVDAAVHTAATPADALSRVVQVLTQSK